MLIRFCLLLYGEVLILSEVVVKVSKGVDVEKVKHRIEAILNLVISDEFDKFMEYLEEYALLRLQEESLREFLEGMLMAEAVATQPEGGQVCPTHSPTPQWDFTMTRL